MDNAGEKNFRHLLCYRKGLHLDVPSLGHQDSTGLAGRTKEMDAGCLFTHFLALLRNKDEPASHEERSQQALPVACPDIVLAQQLVHHLLRHHREAAGVQVEEERA